jgi:hypothetical protein
MTSSWGLGKELARRVRGGWTENRWATLALASIALGVGIGGCGPGQQSAGNGVDLNGPGSTGGGKSPPPPSADGGGKSPPPPSADGGGKSPPPHPADGGAGDGGPTPPPGSDGGGGACAVVDPSTGAAAVTSPANGSRLKATSVDFAWKVPAGATDLRLTVGTTPGAADLFRSSPLGTATGVTATGLPLTGQRIFVQLESHAGGGCTLTRTEYVGPVRRGLAVVADFSDVRLEDWTGDGIRTLDDLRGQLTLMEQHWDFLSRGIETSHWDMIRVTLAQPRTPTAFPGWFEYRAAVADLIKQQVNIADYDVDRNGVLDAVWIIAADGGTSLDYIVGGTARVGDVNIFVDGQNSLSVVTQQTGNFNHELGHCVGLRDLYGTFSTLGDLTVMDSSWNFPREDFSAFDRVQMGWAHPRVVTASTRGVVLRSANDFMDVVKVSLGEPDEYFLLEYKKKPASGFGSAGRPYNGIVVYHALEGSSQNANPPLLKVEPADGAISLGAPELTDLFYPGNPGMKLPVVMRSYIGGQPALQIDDVRWVGDALEVDLEVFQPSAQGLANLIINPGFEDGRVPWTTRAFASDPAVVTFDWTSPGRSSAHSVRIDAPRQPNDADWRQHVFGLDTAKSYRVCGWVKGENIVPFEAGTVGGSIGVANTFTQSSGGLGTFDWTRHCVAFAPSESEADVGCRLGGFGNTVTGKLWCDDITLSALEPAVF